MRRRPKGDRLALALMAVLVLFAFVWDPPTAGVILHGRATELKEEGYRVIPLTLALAARRCDPTAVDYSVTAIELFRDLGHEEEAAELRVELDRQLASYRALVEREKSALGQAGPVPPVDGWSAPPAWKASLGHGPGVFPTYSLAEPARNPEEKLGEPSPRDQAR